MELGTWAWAASTGGTITPSDRRVLDRNVALVVEAATARSPEAGIAFADASPPDSALCREATWLWSEAAPDWLHGHGHRTWYFARALACFEALNPDPELLYVACLLHDLGLTAHAPPTPTNPCFAVTGGRAAAAVVEPHRGEPDATTVGEAIAMHLNIDVPVAAGDVHHLAAAGTLIDVTGIRLQLLPVPYVAAVLDRHPRRDFGPAVGDRVAELGDAFPDTRCGYLHHTLGFGPLSRAHPLDHADGADRVR